jgi:hypothetical protein
LNDTGQLSASLVHAIAIDRVNDKDQALSAREVVSPQRTDLVLTTDVPDVELGVFVGDGLDVEADGGDCCYILVQLEFVEDGCLARRVSTLRTGCKQNGGWISLVLPAASRPSINRRISLLPKILAIIFDIEPPMVDLCVILLC